MRDYQSAAEGLVGFLHRLDHGFQPGLFLLFGGAGSKLHVCVGKFEVDIDVQARFDPPAGQQGDGNQETEQGNRQDRAAIVQRCVQAR